MKLLVASVIVTSNIQIVKLVIQVHLASPVRMVTRDRMVVQVRPVQMEIQDERVHQGRRETRVLLALMETMVQMEKKVDQDVMVIPEDLEKWVHPDLPDEEDPHLLVNQEMMDVEETMVIQDAKVTLEEMASPDVMVETVPTVMQANVETLVKMEDLVKMVDQDKIVKAKMASLDQLVKEVLPVNQDWMVKMAKMGKTEIMVHVVHQDDLVSREKTVAGVMTENKVLQDVQVCQEKTVKKVKLVHQE